MGTAVRNAVHTVIVLTEYAPQTSLTKSTVTFRYRKILNVFILELRHVRTVRPKRGPRRTFAIRL